MDSSFFPADLILRSSAVFTGSEEEPRAAAVAVAGDRIVWVGDPADMPEELQGPDTEVRDFGDALIMPGFHDAHMHVFHSALYLSPLAERFVGDNEADAVARLAPLAARRPAGSWLLTQGWRDYLWDPAGMPSKSSLDAAYSDRPVAMYSGDAHTLWLNSCALERLGITDDTVPPAGGSYDRDEEGHLTGIVREAAAMELMPRIVAEFSTEELLDAYRSFERYLNEHGITGVCDVSLMAMPGLDFVRDDLYAQLEVNDELTVRVSMFPTLLEDRSRLDELQAEHTGPLLQARGFKQFFDGVSSQHTAWVHDPYTNARFDGDCGRPTVGPEVMEALVAPAAAEGHAVRVHAIGDEAIHQCLDIFERHPVEDASARHTIEHLENFQPADIERLARAGVIASVQPRHITLDPGGPERDLGAERVPYMWPFRTLLDTGAILAFGTDSPVTDIDPLDAVYTAVTRRDADTHEPEGGWLPEEAITLAEALRAYTAGSAAAAQRSGELGELAPGQYADLVALSPNPFALPPEDVQQAKVQATYVGGKQVYGAD
ncbi:amidohydrolase [Adlercreutzia equolifaciens]|uniref:amidohydrolase n=1 Tax=Adlercreutzia equolifaciens TaxID=446660 RepID=UPI0023AFFE2F|nr:amidohydrolase [Adlercreutzia equolifaciens]MDE8703505.1 amidohydrolase [Adlercreutzia equolifaciens]